MERRQALYPHEKGAAAGEIDAALSQARRHLSAGEFFEAHDALEPAWKAADGELKAALQGLIQIAAGLHKRARGETAGASYLIARGLEKLQRASSAIPQDIVALFLKAAGSGR